MLRRSLVFALVVMSAQVARGQILEPGGRRSGSGQPEAWTSLSIGWLRQGGLCDPSSNACWAFGSAAQWRASLEFPMGRGASAGGAATVARVPLTYSGGGTSGCSGCDADANVYQYLGTLHLGSGATLQQAIDVSAGVTVFTNFRTATGARLGPGKAVTNFSFAVAYGFAYAFSPNFQVMLAPEYGLVVGKRMSGVANNSAEQITTRIGVRYALGG